MGERRGVYRVLVRKPERKRTLGRSRPRWEDNIYDGSSGSGMWGSWPGHTGANVLLRGDIGGLSGGSSYPPGVIDVEYSLSSPKTVCAC
jgi:hypothetical protein